MEKLEKFHGIAIEKRFGRAISSCMVARVPKQRIFDTFSQEL